MLIGDIVQLCSVVCRRVLVRQRQQGRKGEGKERTFGNDESVSFGEGTDVEEGVAGCYIINQERGGAGSGQDSAVELGIGGGEGRGGELSSRLVRVDEFERWDLTW